MRLVFYLHMIRGNTSRYSFFSWPVPVLIRLWQSVKALEQSLEELRSSLIAKPKFSFKRKPHKQTALSPMQHIPLSASSKPDRSSFAPETSRPSSSVSLSGHSRQFLSWASVPPSTASATDLSISDLDHCIVNLLVATSSSIDFTALHIRNVKNTLLLLPFIHGSAMIHDMTNCTVALGCHQVCTHFVFCYINGQFNHTDLSIVCIRLRTSMFTSPLNQIQS
jgi:hypothetical protein